jgi:CheY-like chemotaxis protein
VLDLQLALFDTLQAVRQLRQRGYDRHIVGVIPVEEQLLGKLLHSAGCTAVLPRPVEPWQLVATLSAA